MGMAVPDGIHDLEEDVLGLCILTQVISFLGDFGEEVTFWAVLQDDKGAIVRLEDLLHGHHVRMLAGLVVQPDLTILEAPLPRVDTHPVQGLDGVLGAGGDVPRVVDGSIRTHSQDVGQLDLVIAARENEAQPVIWAAESGWLGGRRRRRDGEHFQRAQRSFRRSSWLSNNVRNHRPEIKERSVAMEQVVVNTAIQDRKGKAG